MLAKYLRHVADEIFVGLISLIRAILFLPRAFNLSGK